MFQKMLQIGSGGVSIQSALYKFDYTENTGWKLTNPKGNTKNINSELYEDAYIYAYCNESKLILKDPNCNYTLHNFTTGNTITTKGNSSNYWYDLSGQKTHITVEGVDYNKIP